MQAKTYLTKLVCVNCGMRDFYTLPYGSEFMPFEGPDEAAFGQRVLSHFRSTIPEQRFENEIEETIEKNCRNCGLPFLVGEYWDKKELPELVKTPEIKDTKA